MRVGLIFFTFTTRSKEKSEDQVDLRFFSEQSKDIGSAILAFCSLRTIRSKQNMYMICLLNETEIALSISLTL